MGLVIDTPLESPAMTQTFSTAETWTDQETAVTLALSPAGTWKDQETVISQKFGAAET